MFTMSVDDDGNLYVDCADDVANVTFEYDETSGNLYYVTE